MTREEIIQAITDDKMMPFIQSDQLANIVDFVIKNSQPSLSSNLDEAAEKAGLEYAPKQEGEAIDLNGDVYATDDVEWPSRCGFIQGFKAGAEWMAGQGFVYEDKVYPTSYEHEPTEFCLDGGEEIRLLTEAVNNNILKQGDKVIVQIRKK